MHAVDAVAAKSACCISDLQQETACADRVPQRHMHTQDCLKGQQMFDTTGAPASTPLCLLRRDGCCTCKLRKVVPSLTSRNTHLPPPASRPVFTHPPIVSVCPTCIVICGEVRHCLRDMLDEA